MVGVNPCSDAILMMLIQSLRLFGFGLGRADERSVIRQMWLVRRKTLRFYALQAVFHKAQAACNTTRGDNERMSLVALVIP